MLSWRKYNGALIPNGPPHIDVDVTGIEKMIKKERVYFARWTTKFDCSNTTNFWHVICDKFIPMDLLSRNTRNNTRRGLRRCRVKQVDNQFVVDNCYPVYKAAFDNYDGHVSSVSEEDFKQEYMGYNDSDLWHFWVVYENETNQIIAYTRNRIEYNQCELCTTKFHPDFLRRYYPSEALFYTMNDYYLKEKKFIYINDGARSISHETNIQDFLIQKFKFRKAYCKLHIIYSQKVKLLLLMIYPFRSLVQYFKTGFFVKLNILIKQEEIRRSYE